MVAEDRGKVRERKVRLLPPPQLITRDMEMEKDLRFLELKQELLNRAHKAGACKEQYSRAYGAQTLEELMDVVKDNFFWAVNNEVLDGEFIDKWSEEFNDSKIWHNQSVSSGYLIAYGNATVRASDNATVIAYGNATVRAYDNATVRAYDNATVAASGNATVEAYDNAYVTSWDIFECKLSDAAIWRIQKENIIRYADNNMKFEKITQ